MANNLTAVISADTSKFVEEVKSAQYMLDKFVKEQKNLKASAKGTTSVTNEQVAAYQRVIKSLDKVASGTMSTAKQEKELKKQLQELKIQWANLSDTAKRSDFGKSLSDSCKVASKQLQTLKTQIKQVGDEIKNTNAKSKGGFNLGFDFKKMALGGAAMATGIGSVAAGAQLAFEALKSGAKATMDFNKQQSTLQAVTGRSAEELEGLKQQALDLGSKTKYTASEIAGLQIELAKLGFDPAAIDKMTNHVQNLASATGSDLADAASLAGSTLRMFNLNSEDSQRVADVLAKSCSASALSFGYLDSAMSTIGPVANAFGMSLEDTVGILGTLANAGFDASSAATAGRNIILNLADANGKLAKAMGQPITSGKEMMEALKQLRDRGVNLAEALELTDKRSVAAFNTLLDGSTKGKELITTLEGCKGAAKEMSDVMSDNLEGDMASLSSAWEGLMLELGGGQSLIRTVVQWLTKLVQKVKDNVQAIVEWANDLYDNSMIVRAILNSIMMNFKMTFNTIVLIVKTAMNNIKGFFVVIGKVLEGDFSGAVKAWRNMLDTNHKNTLDYVAKQKKAISGAVDATIKGRQKANKNATPADNTKSVTSSNGKTGIGGTTPGSGKGKTTKTKVKVEYEYDSLDYWKAQLQKLQKELSSKRLSVVDTKATQKEIEDARTELSKWETKVSEFKAQLENNSLTPVEAKKVKGQLNTATKHLEEWKTKLENLKKQVSVSKVSVVDAKKIQDEITKVKGIIEKKEIELGIKAKEGSLEYIEHQISEIDTQLKKLDPKIDMAEIENLKFKKQTLEDAKKQVEAALSTVTVTGKKFESKGAEGSQQYAKDKVSYYQQRLELSVEGTEEFDYLMKQLKEWTAKENEIKVNVQSKLSDAKDGSMKFLSDKISNLQAKLEVEAYGTPEYNKINKELQELIKQKQKIEVQIDFDGKSALDKYEDITGAFRGVDGIVGSMNGLIDSIEDGANAWETFMGVVNVVDSVLDGVVSTIQAVDTVQKMLGVTTEATSAIQTAAAEQDVTNTATEVANSTTRIAVKSGEAIAGATASGAAMPFPLNLVAIAAGIAAVIAAISMIGSFANGGIIQGATTIGDYNLARVNSGEMILNGRQQNNLFKAIDENRLGGSGGTVVGGEVKIKGSDLYIALKNYSKVQGTLGKNTGIR